MSDLRFSIVIPTRQRHETLYHTLRTCLEQDFEAYEIIVSDNQSSAKTLETVASFHSDKLKYFRTPQALSMTNNFEFAVAQARGEYILVIGDDDGILPGALSELDALIQETGEKAITWDHSYYYWPNMAVEQKKNTVSLSAGLDPRHRVQFKGESAILNVANYHFSYSVLPMLYHTVIHRDLIQTLRDLTGAVFKSKSPDVYSGFALAFVAQTYIRVGKSYSVMGISGKSTGWAFMVADSTLTSDFDERNRQDNLNYHPQVPDCVSMPSCVVDGFHHAKDALFSKRTDLMYDEKCFLVNCIASTYWPHQEQENIRKILTALSDRPMLKQWFKTTVIPNLETIKRDLVVETPQSCITPSIEGLDVLALYGVENIFDLTQNFSRILRDQSLVATAS